MADKTGLLLRRKDRRLFLARFDRYRSKDCLRLTATTKSTLFQRPSWPMKSSSACGRFAHERAGQRPTLLRRLRALRLSRRTVLVISCDHQNISTLTLKSKNKQLAERLLRPGDSVELTVKPGQSQFYLEYDHTFVYGTGKIGRTHAHSDTIKEQLKMGSTAFTAIHENRRTGDISRYSNVSVRGQVPAVVSASRLRIGRRETAVMSSLGNERIARATSPLMPETPESQRRTVRAFTFRRRASVVCSGIRVPTETPLDHHFADEGAVHF